MQLAQLAMKASSALIEATTQVQLHAPHAISDASPVFMDKVKQLVAVHLESLGDAVATPTLRPFHLDQLATVRTLLLGPLYYEPQPCLLLLQTKAFMVQAIALCLEGQGLTEATLPGLTAVKQFYNAMASDINNKIHLALVIKTE